MGHRSLQQKQKFSGTTVVLASDCFNPNLKASMFGPVFRGLKPPVPSVAAKYNCSTRAGQSLWICFPPWICSPPWATTASRRESESSPSPGRPYTMKNLWFAALLREYFQEHFESLQPPHTNSSFPTISSKDARTNEEPATQFLPSRFSGFRTAVDSCIFRVQERPACGERHSDESDGGSK